jgi:uncharacterized secreted protein with C-terminal beta-propeller domain
MLYRLVNNTAKFTLPAARGLRRGTGNRKRRRLLLEQLEDRCLMDAAGFVHTDPEPDPGSVVGVAGIEAQDDYAGISSGTTQLRIDVLANDPLPDGVSSLRIKSVSATARGATVSISDDGRRIIYTPPASGSTYDSFYYIVEADDGKLGKANVTIGDKHTVQSGHVEPPPEPSRDDDFQFFEDSGEQILDVLRNDDRFRDGEIIEVTSAHYGTVRIAENGQSLIYQPYPATVGWDRFEYTVQKDGETATCSVEVRIVKPYEIVSDGDSYRTYIRDVGTGPHTFNLLANDRILAPTPERPRIVDIQYPAYAGDLQISADGRSVTFTPADDFLGTFGYSYTVRYGPLDHQTIDGAGSVRVQNTFLAVDNWFAVDIDSPSRTFDVLANDPVLKFYDGYWSAVPGVTLKIVAATAGSYGGQIAIANNGLAIQYRPAAGFSGDETFTYTVKDSNGHHDSATVTVHVAEPVGSTGLPKFFLPGELQQFLLDRAVEQYKNSFGITQLQYVGSPSDGSPNSTAYLMYALDNVATTSAAELSHSETNTQEEGVDEADIVETDGRYLYTFSDGKLVIADLRNLRHPRLASFTEFDDRFTEMYLQGDRVTLLDRGSYHDGKTTAVVMVLDVSNRRDPTIVERTEIDGRIVDSRAVGDRVYVAVSGFQVPELDQHVLAGAEAPEGYEVQVNETLDEYVARVYDSIIETSLPVYRTYGPDGELTGSGVLTDPADIHQPMDRADKSLLSLVTFDADDDQAGPLSSTGIFTNTATDVYMSGDSFYVLRNHGGDTAVFKFKVTDDGSSQLVATGKVDGWLLNQFSVDEHDGRLRIATTETVMETVGHWTTRQQRRFNNLFVLEQHGTQLDEVGSVKNLAPTETIKSVRFLDDRAYVTTFRVVDPLFAVDLSDPTHPTVEGALKIPGFSDYLHPVGEDYVIGIGYDANEITGHVGPPQISLFYVGDLSNPTLVDQVTMEGAQWASTEASYDHHAVAYFAEHQVLTIPVCWTESSRYDQHSAIWTFQIDVDGSGGGSIDVTGSVEHEGRARRSVRIGEALVTVSNDVIKINRLHDPDVQISELYLGRLPRDDTFTILEDSGPNVLDVRENDLPGDTGHAPRIVAVSQPVQVRYWGWMTDSYLLPVGEPTSDSVGVVEITDHGRAISFTPSDNFFGTVTFTYTVFDELRGEQEATVTVHVENMPEDPDAVDDQFQVEPGSTAVVLNVLANDVGEYPFLISSVGTFVADFPTDLVVTRPLTTDVSVVSTPLVELPVTALGLTSQGDTVQDVWIAPTPLFDLTITAVGPTSHGGTVEIDQSGQGLTYTPAADFVGVETFSYTITTMSGRTDTATVSVYVGVDLLPYATGSEVGVSPPPTLQLAPEPAMRQTLQQRDPTGPEQISIRLIPPDVYPSLAQRRPEQTAGPRTARAPHHWDLGKARCDLEYGRLDKHVQASGASASVVAQLQLVDAAFALAEVQDTTGLDDAIASGLAASLCPDSLLFI